MSITIGADPELMVADNGKIIAGIGLIGGSKEEPRPTEHGAVQEDNVLAEFNINPASSAAEFVSSITNVRRELDEILAPFTTVVKSSHHFDVDTLVNAGPKAMEFGCDPDYNCWTESVNSKPCSAQSLRTAGGHVHIGYDNPTPDESYRVARMCDVFLGIPSLLLDSDTERRQLYGAAGACRLKAYGVEYRSLSNFWLDDATVTAWVFDQAKLCSEHVGELDSILDYFGSTDEIQRIINEGDIEAARAAIDGLSINMPKVTYAA